MMLEKMLNKRIKKNTNNVMDKTDKVFVMVGAVIAAFQLIVLIYFNLTQLRYHIDFDSSANFLKTMEIVEQGKFMIDNWASTTGYSMISPAIIATLIYRIVDDIFIAFGLANVLIILATVAFLIKLAGLFNISIPSTVVGINLYLCPYITGEYNVWLDGGYAPSMLVGAGYYSAMVLLFLMCLVNIFSWKRDLKHIIFSVVVSVLLCLAAMTNGMYVWSTFLAAGLFYNIVKIIQTDDYKVIKSYSFIFFSVNFILSLIFRKIGTMVLGIDTLDRSLVYVTVNDFFEAMGAVWKGIINYVGGLPSAEPYVVMSGEGIIYLLSWGIIAVMLIALIYAVKTNVLTDTHDWKQFLTLLIIENIIMFVICDAVGSARILPVRYLLISFFAILFLTMQYIDKQKENRYFYNVMVMGLLVVALAKNIWGDLIYQNKKNNYDKIERVVDIVNQYDVPVVFCYGEDISGDARNMRVIGYGKVYREMTTYNSAGTWAGESMFPVWGDYTYYVDNAEWKGANCLIATTDGFEELPPYIKCSYMLVDQVDEFNIYYSKVNKFDLASDMSDKTIDFPYSKGYVTQNGYFDEEGNWVTNGLEGYCLYGPYAETKAGRYKVRLNYEIIAEGKTECLFDVAVEHGNDMLASGYLDSNSNFIELEVELEEGKQVEYRVYNTRGCIVKIKSIEVELLK
ncbi:MAG: hypothetical protein NC428_00865 [Clostridium sp.]|nr:hypothetical protein [Clostridium sp.]